MSAAEPNPPRLALLLLRLRLREQERAGVESDLRDLLSMRTSRGGIRHARRRYWRDVISVCLHASESGRHVTPQTPTERVERSTIDAFRQDVVYALRSLRPGAAVHGDGRRHPGARDRREQRDLQRPGRGPPPAAAVPRCRAGGERRVERGWTPPVLERRQVPVLARPRALLRRDGDMATVAGATRHRMEACRPSKRWA